MRAGTAPQMPHVDGDMNMMVRMDDVMDLTLRVREAERHAHMQALVVEWMAVPRVPQGFMSSECVSNTLSWMKSRRSS